MFVSSLLYRHVPTNIPCFQSDFSGRVVNNDHFLYGGDIVKTNEEGVDFHIQVTKQYIAVTDIYVTGDRELILH